MAVIPTSVWKNYHVSTKQHKLTITFSLLSILITLSFRITFLEVLVP